MTQLPKSLTDEQEMFSTAYIGLAGQGWEKSIDNSKCVYRAPKTGKKCAIGHCIPDNLYDESFEGFDVYRGLRLLGDVNKEMYWFADALQECHDRADTPENMKQRFHDFAEEHSLTIPEIK